MRLKLLWKKDEVRLMALSLLLAAVLLALRRQPGIAANSSDLFFTVGTVHILAGAVHYIRNVGLFKTFSYMAYKRRFRRGAGRDGESHPMSLADFNETVIMDETRHKAVARPLLTGIICWGVSLLFVLFV